MIDRLKRGRWTEWQDVDYGGAQRRERPIIFPGGFIKSKEVQYRKKRRRKPR